MLIWLIFAVITAVVMVVLLTPFYRPNNDARTREAYDREVYRDQLQELDGDVEHGLIGEDEAAAARLEISRRLLSAKDDALTDRTASSYPSHSAQFRTLTFWTVSLAVPALALGGYLYLGDASAPGQPHATRFAKPLEEQKISILIARVEARLRARPDDGRGWEVIAPVYMRQGRFVDAANAYQRALRINGEKLSLLRGYAEALISDNQGIVTDAARAAYEKVLAKNKGDLRARFRIALADEQDGQYKVAAEKYRELMLLGDPEGSWRKLVVERLAFVNQQMSGSPRGEKRADAAGGKGGAMAEAQVAPGPTQSDIRAVQGMSAQGRAEMINSMVTRLANRLKENGDDIEGWLRLINAHMVLGKGEQAKSALKTARVQFKDNTQGLARLDQLATKLGLRD